MRAIEQERMVDGRLKLNGSVVANGYFVGETESKKSNAPLQPLNLIILSAKI